MGEVLLEPTVIYASTIEDIAQKVRIKGMVHITGGGFPENLPRMSPSNLACQIQTTAWQIPPVFTWLQKVRSDDTKE